MIRLLGAMLLVGVSQLAVRATILDLAGERLDFTSFEALKDKAAWGGPAKYPLDLSSEGLGSAAVGERGEIEAWVETAPLAVGAWRQPWSSANFSVEIDDGVDAEQRARVGRVFVRYGPDRKHWTTWHAMERKSTAELEFELKRSTEMWAKANPDALKEQPFRSPDVTAYTSRTIFKCSLEIPRTTRASYEQLLADFAQTNPPRPKFHEDAVRWILAQDPGYFRQEIPFIGYVQFLVEANVGQTPRRLKSVLISGMSLVDELMGHLTDTNRADFEGPWRFVAP